MSDRDADVVGKDLRAAGVIDVKQLLEDAVDERDLHVVGHLGEARVQVEGDQPHLPVRLRLLRALGLELVLGAELGLRICHLI